MRKRFWVGLITCLFAAFSVLPFAVISEENRDGPVVAGAWVKGGSKKRAKGRVSASGSIRGAWGISVKAGSNSAGKSDYYRNGVSKNYSVSAYTSSASASSWITGYNNYGNTYSAGASESSGG